jgi:PBSX family phage terminase large subunit
MKKKLIPTINFPSFYKEPIKVLTDDDTIKEVVFFSGRNSGKTLNVSQVVVLATFMEKDNNVLIVRATKSQIKDSSFQEIMNVIESLGLYDCFNYKHKAMRIENKFTGAIIYFEGVDNDPEKIKGFSPRNRRLAFIVFEEFTELRDDYPLKVARDTLIRYKGASSNGGLLKIIKLGNPSRWNSHWSWDIIEMDKKNPKTKVYAPTWETIRPYLEKHTIEAIEEAKELTPRYYRWAYLGERLSYEGLVYDQFSIDNLVSMDEFKDKKPIALICGLDPASKRDKTALIIGILFNSGELLFLDMWHYNPKEEGNIPLSPSQQAEKIVKFLNRFLNDVNNVNYRLLPKYIICDPANGGIDIEIRNNYNNYFNVINVPNKHRKVDIQRNQNAMATGRVKFLENVDNLKPLYDELSMMVWREKNLGRELKTLKSTALTIGEDDCHDAMTYAINFALTNAKFMKYNPDLFNNIYL